MSCGYIFVSHSFIHAFVHCLEQGSYFDNFSLEQVQGLKDSAAHPLSKFKEAAAPPPPPLPGEGGGGGGAAGVREPKFSKCRDNSDFLLVRIFRQLENQHNFPNHFAGPNKQLLLKQVWENPLSVETLWNFLTAGQFSLFQTLPDLLVYFRP